MKLTRRQILEMAAAAAAAPVFPRGVEARAAANAGNFFTAGELALVDQLSEIILPADAHSGGARAAGVAGFIDGRLAEYDPAIPALRQAQEFWRSGLAEIERLAQASAGKPYLDLEAAQQVAILENLAKAEAAPATASEKFFVELKRLTARGYYTSKIGIKDEMEYQGNTLLNEFAGTDVATLPPLDLDTSRKE